jgi:hypothetical protein
MGLGDLATAEVSFQYELDQSISLGETATLGTAHSNVAEHAYRRGDLESAARHQLAALHVACQLDDRISISFSMILASRLAHRRGDLAIFVALNAAGEALLASIGAHLYDDDRQITDQLAAQARLVLGSDADDAAKAAGSALDLPDAIALTDQALASISPTSVA